MADYTITLKNEKSVFYNRLGVLFILANVFFFVYLAFFAVEKRIQTGSIALLVFLSFIFLLQHYLKRTRWRFGLHPYSFFIMMAWLNGGIYWMAVIVFILDLLNTAATMKKLVFVSKASILYPSVPKKRIQWTDLNNVILKDGLLTIDFSNNKIIQQMVDENTTAVNEPEFNDFCRQQLNR